MHRIYGCLFIKKNKIFGLDLILGSSTGKFLLAKLSGRKFGLIKKKIIGEEGIIKSLLKLIAPQRS